MSKIFKFLNKKIAIILIFLYYFILYGVIIFNFSSLVACAATNSGGTTEIIYGADSKDIPIVDFLNNNYWYCGMSGSNAASNVLDYYNNVLDNCKNYYNTFSNIHCEYNPYMVGTFVPVYSLLGFYLSMFAAILIANILLYKIDKATEALDLINDNPVK